MKRKSLVQTCMFYNCHNSFEKALVLSTGNVRAAAHETTSSEKTYSIIANQICKWQHEVQSCFHHRLMNISCRAFEECLLKRISMKEKQKGTSILKIKTEKILLNENSNNYLIGARQLEFKTEELLNSPHCDSTGAADEPLHQILLRKWIPA